LERLVLLWCLLSEGGVGPWPQGPLWCGVHSSTSLLTAFCRALGVVLHSDERPVRPTIVTVGDSKRLTGASVCAGGSVCNKGPGQARVYIHGCVALMCQQLRVTLIPTCMYHT
jgi:hypothetical protein